MAEQEPEDMRVRFKRDFDWRPPEARGLVIITARGGDTKPVRRAMGDEAVAEGAGDEVDEEGNVIPPRPRPEEPETLELTEPDHIPLVSQQDTNTNAGDPEDGDGKAP